MLLASRMQTKKVVCWCDLCAFSICVLCVMAELWTSLPRRLQLLFGDAGGDMPCCDILLATGSCCEPEVLADVSAALTALKSKAELEASRHHKRRALVPVPIQGMVVRVNKLRRIEASDAAFTTAWLRKAGTIKRQGVWPTRRSRHLAAAQDGVSRKEIEQQELVRWRGELVAILREAELLVCAQASLASNPDTRSGPPSIVGGRVPRPLCAGLFA